MLHFSVVEESHAGKGHNDAVLAALFDDQVIADGTAGLSNVLDTGSDTAPDRVGAGHAGGRLQLLDQLPGVQSSSSLLCILHLF